VKEKEIIFYLLLKTGRKDGLSIINNIRKETDNAKE